MLVCVMVTSVVGYLYSCFIGWPPVFLLKVYHTCWQRQANRFGNLLLSHPSMMGVLYVYVQLHLMRKCMQCHCSLGNLLLVSRPLELGAEFSQKAQAPSSMCSSM